MGNPMTPFFPQQLQPAPFFGTVIASATSTANESKDVISAATNANGIIITSISIFINETVSGTSIIEFKINSSTIATVHAVTGSPSAVFTMCNIQIPAGQSVSYAFQEGSTGSTTVAVSYKVAGSP